MLIWFVVFAAINLEAILYVIDRIDAAESSLLIIMAGSDLLVLLVLVTNTKVVHIRETIVSQIGHFSIAKQRRSG